MRTKNQRIFVLLICAAMMITAFFSLSYIIHETDHDCTGRDCPVCACIHNAEQNLKQLGTGIVFAVSAHPMAIYVSAALLYVFYRLYNETLIDLKVRLDH